STTTSCASNARFWSCPSVPKPPNWGSRSPGPAWAFEGLGAIEKHKPRALDANARTNMKSTPPWPISDLAQTGVRCVKPKISRQLVSRRPQPGQRRTPGPASWRSVLESLDVWALGEDPAHDGALNALAFAVDQPNLSEPALARCLQVPFHRDRNVAGL